jgi:hypothetical protein
MSPTVSAPLPISDEAPRYGRKITQRRRRIWTWIVAATVEKEKIDMKIVVSGVLQ